MANNVLLDNVTHKNLRIITRRGAEYGDNIRCALIVPREFRQIESDYPIVFRKNLTTDQFESVALFGFNEKENLFLDGANWIAGYIPWSVERIPFMIGYTRDQETGMQQPVIHVDMENPRISFSEGEAVFLEHGGKTDYLEHISSILAELISGMDASKIFMEMLISLDLLEAFTLKIDLKNNSGLELTGFYTINEEKLRQLTSDELYKLHEKGLLEHIYMVVASLSNIRRMVQKKQIQN